MGSTPRVKLTAAENKQIQKGFDTIREVMKKRNIDIANIIGLVTTDQVKTTTSQVKVKFAEETAAHMNMIAFD
jgi:ribosomal protein S10